MRILFFTSFVLGLALANTVIDAEIKPRFCETEVTAFFTCLQGVLSTGIPEVGLPSLESLSFTDLEIDLNSLGTDALTIQYNLDNPTHMGPDNGLSETGIGGKNASVHRRIKERVVRLTNGRITEIILGNILIRELLLNGLTGFAMNNLVVKSDLIGGMGLKIGGDLSFAQLSAASKMKLDASLDGNKLSGDGDFSIGLSDLNINFLLRIRIMDFSIKELKLVPTIQDLQYSSKDLMIGDKSLEDWIAQHEQDLKDLFDYLISLIQKPAFLQEYGTPRADIWAILLAILGKCPIDLSCFPI